MSQAGRCPAAFVIAREEDVQEGNAPGPMCLLKIKDELHSEPVRVKEVRRVRRVRRSYSPERYPTARYINTRIVEERRTPSYNPPPPQSIPPPPAPPSVHAEAPPDDAPPPPPSVINSEHASVKSKRTSRAPSVHQSAIIVENEAEEEEAPPKSVHSAAAPYVEVSHEAESVHSSSPSSASDVRSQSTHHTSNTHKTATTKRSSVSSPKSTVARSEYSEHEKEFRRERAWSSGQRHPEYATYQYVNAPSNYDRRASRGSFGYRSSNERQIVQRDYYR